MQKCLECTKFDVCPKSTHIENYSLRTQCSEFICKEDNLETTEEVEE